MVRLSGNRAQKSYNHIRGGGGAIYNDGSLRIQDSLFEMNAVLDVSHPQEERGSGGGGAIYNDGSAQIFRTRFVGNRSVKGFGGAIVNPGAMSMSGAEFVENTSSGGTAAAIQNGGSLRMAKTPVSRNGEQPPLLDDSIVASAVTMEINDSEFTSNRARIVVSGGASTWIRGSTFSQNARVRVGDYPAATLAVGREGARMLIGRSTIHGETGDASAVYCQIARNLSVEDTTISLGAASLAVCTRPVGSSRRVSFTDAVPRRC